jgi:hypothetical protein
MFFGLAERTRLKLLTDRLGISRRMNSLLLRLLDVREEIRFRRFRSGMETSAASSRITAAILTVDPSRTLPACLESVRSQNLPPCAVKVIRNVSPFSRASQEALDSIATEYYVQVDDDMVLHPTCFERLFFLMETEPHCAQSVVQLSDPVFGTVTGVKMYRTEPVRKVGFFPLRGEKGCERHMTERLQALGYVIARSRSIEGIHHPEYTAHDMYWKFHFLGEQLRYYPDTRNRMLELVTLLSRRWEAHHDNLTLFGIAGLFSGLQSEDAGSELDYSTRDRNPAFDRLKEFLDTLSGAD